MMLNDCISCMIARYSPLLLKTWQIKPCSLPNRVPNLERVGDGGHIAFVVFVRSYVRSSVRLFVRSFVALFGRSRN